MRRYLSISTIYNMRRYVYINYVQYEKVSIYISYLQWGNVLYIPGLTYSVAEMESSIEQTIKDIHGSFLRTQEDFGPWLHCQQDLGLEVPAHPPTLLHILGLYLPLLCQDCFLRLLRTSETTWTSVLASSWLLGRWRGRSWWEGSWQVA